MSATAANLSKTTIIGPSCRELFLPLTAEMARPLAELGVLLAGYSVLQPPYVMHRPKQGFHLLLYSVEGEGRLWIGGREERFTEKSLWLVPAGLDVHYEQHVPMWRICWFHLKSTPVWRHLQQVAPGAIDPGESERVAWLMQGLVDEYHVTRPEQQAAGKGYAQLLAVYLRRVLGSRVPTAQERLRQRIEQVWAQVEEDPARAWTVPELAHRACMSPTHLFRLCKTLFDCTPLDHVRRIRLRRAQTLLQHTDYPQEAIASMVGYSTVYAFAKAFTREMGSAPGRFREQASSGGS